MWYLFNFVIFLFLLWFFVFRHLGVFLESRSKRLELDIARAAKERGKAMAALEELELKFGELGRRIEGVKERIRKDGEMERDTLIRKARHSVRRLKEDVDEMLLHLERHFHEKILMYVVDSAVAKAREKLKKKIQQSDHERFVISYLERLRKSGLNLPKRQ